MKLRRILFWIHLTLGIATGLIGALMAGTGVIMAFADTCVDVREWRLRQVESPKGSQPQSLAELLAKVNAKYPGSRVNRIRLDADPAHAVEFYHDPQKLDYVNPFSGETRPSDSVPLRRKLHKGVEQWHRFLGLTGEQRATGKLVVSWTNVAIIPLLVTGLGLWWPARLRWPAIQAGLLPTGAGRGRGTQRSWHAAFGFWALLLLLIMVATATTHSFDWVRNSVQRIAGSSPVRSAARDSLWAPGLAKRALPDGARPLTPDQLREIADRETPGWTRLDIFLPEPPGLDGKTAPVSLTVRVSGWGPSFFPVVLQADPHTGELLDTHSWASLGRGTKLLAWSRWLHKGEAFGRPGQILFGLACLVMLALIYTGWALAIRRWRQRLQ
jgi:uncharacterized iron-regulated membrane protein